MQNDFKNTLIKIELSSPSDEEHRNHLIKVRQQPNAKLHRRRLVEDISQGQILALARFWFWLAGKGP